MHKLVKMAEIQDGDKVFTLYCTNRPKGQPKQDLAEDYMQENVRLRELVNCVGEGLLIHIAQLLTTARRRHPDFARDHAEAVAYVESEFLEWKSQAMLAGLPESKDRRALAEGEMLHLIAVGIRYLGREYVGGRL